MGWNKSAVFKKRCLALIKAYFQVLFYIPPKVLFYTRIDSQSGPGYAWLMQMQNYFVLKQAEIEKQRLPFIVRWIQRIVIGGWVV